MCCQACRKPSVKFNRKLNYSFRKAILVLQWLCYSFCKLAMCCTVTLLGWHVSTCQRCRDWHRSVVRKASTGTSVEHEIRLCRKSSVGFFIWLKYAEHPVHLSRTWSRTWCTVETALFTWFNPRCFGHRECSLWLMLLSNWKRLWPTLVLFCWSLFFFIWYRFFMI